MMILYQSVVAMLRFLIIFSSASTIFVNSVVEPGPLFTPTKGAVWPKPQQEQKEETFYKFDNAQFRFNIINQNCTILAEALHRYGFAMNKLNDIAELYGSRRHAREARSSEKTRFVRADTMSLQTVVQPNDVQQVLQELEIDLTAPCEEYPYFGMNESYNLTVSTTSKLTSASIWGILRGLETFSHLFYLTDDYKEVRVNGTQIYDFPRHAHRGLLLDTSRHFISLPNILLTLDAMAMNKMNVFHWHIVDDQSFPYQSEKFPELSDKGAYHSSMVYTKSDIQKVINYARDRGIRVVPEFDVPGHTRSWGAAYPDILTECYKRNKVIGLGPMNPIRNMTYKLLHDLFQEVQTLFPDKYFHIGGDEVELSCWKSNHEIRVYMREHRINSFEELHALFMRKTIPLLANNSNPIVWQEVFDEGVSLSQDTLVHVWKDSFPVNEMKRVLFAGHRLLYSGAWYLDHLDKNFRSMLTIDPWQMVYDSTGNASLADGVVGGEACMWGEMADGTNILSRVWPRASAVAERLWSPGLGRTRNAYVSMTVPNEALHRIEEHTCRMVRRGVPAQPANGPGFCVV